MYSLPPTLRFMVTFRPPILFVNSAFTPKRSNSFSSSMELSPSSNISSFPLCGVDTPASFFPLSRVDVAKSPNPQRTTLPTPVLISCKKLIQLVGNSCLTIGTIVPLMAAKFFSDLDPVMFQVSIVTGVGKMLLSGSLFDFITGNLLANLYSSLSGFSAIMRLRGVACKFDDRQYE